MTETLLSALALALLTGITIVAYRHPQSYKRFHGWLIVVISTAWGLCVTIRAVYSAGFSQGQIALMKLNAANFKDAPKLVDQPSESPWLFAGPVLLIVYLVLLAALPGLGVTGEKKEKN